MRNRNSGVLLLAMLQSCLLFSQTADHKQPGFYFNGKEFHLGMSEREAMAELSECCKLSPPPKSDADNAGYFVIAKGEGSQPIIGGIWFKGQTVVSISREIANDVDTSNDELVAFMRAFKRSLPEEMTTAVIAVRHEQAMNAESDILTLEFPDGRRIQIHIVTLDKAVAGSKRDFVTFEEILGSTE
jgi:hypothetical protein